MTDLKEAIAMQTNNLRSQMAPLPETQHPKGWEPGVVWSGTHGTITSKPVENQDPRWDVWLKSWGFDPKLFRIVEPVQMRTWEAAIGNGETKQFWYYKASIESRPEGHDELDVEELIKEVKTYKAPKKPRPIGEQAFIVPIADPQIGKDDGDGTLGTIQRMVERIDLVKARYTELRKIGRELGTLVVGDLGDSIESCYGNYSTQTFKVQLNQREQMRVYRRLLTRMLKTWALDFDKVIVFGVKSNHTQNRQNGKIATNDADDFGLSNMECLAEAFSENPAFDHVSFVIPEDEPAVVLDVCGTPMAFTHMHETIGGGSPQAKAKNWWSGQSFGNRPAGDARVLVSAHYHHFMVTEHAESRVHIQCPKMDGGSDYFRNQTGIDSKPGILTFVTGAGVDYQDLAIL